MHVFAVGALVGVVSFLTVRYTRPPYVKVVTKARCPNCDLIVLNSRLR